MQFKKPSRRLKHIGVGVFIIVILPVLYLIVLNLTGNFHMVVPGQLYRSAQLESKDIPYLKSHYHIQTILNLRGENTGRPWYDDEVKAAKEAGIHHIDFRMSSARELKSQEALALIELMRNAPKPLLVHCQAGADRTGLASAMYVAAISKGGEEAAERQLWPIYGHLSIWFLRAFAMDNTFEALEPYFGFPNS